MLHRLLKLLFNLSKPIKDKAIKSKVIARSNDFKVNEIMLQSGSLIKEHTTPIPAFFLVLKGKVAFKYSDETINLSKDDYLTIKANEPHSVEALADSKVLLVK